MPQKISVYRRNHGQRRSKSRIVKAVRDLIHNFKKTCFKCDRSLPGRSSFLLEAVGKFYETIRDFPLASALRVPQLPNSSVCKILSAVLHMFPYRFLDVLIRYDKDGSLLLCSYSTSTTT